MEAAWGADSDHVYGTMIWVNLNHLKNRNWEELLGQEKDYLMSEPFHTFTMHNTKSAGSVAEERWWSQQSNVHGFVLAYMRIPVARENDFPRKCSNNIVRLFLPTIRISESDFPAADHLLLTECTHDDRANLWQLAKQGIRIAKEKYQSSKDKDGRHLGGSLGVVKNVLKFQFGMASDEEGSSRVGGNSTGTLETPHRVTVQRKLPKEVRDEYDPAEPWPSLDHFMSNFSDEKLVVECDVAVFKDEDVDTGVLLKIYAEQLKAALCNALHCSPVRGLIAAFTPRPKSEPSAKAARRDKEQTEMVLNIDYDRWDNFFYNETLVNYVVWVIDRTKLETLLAEKSRQIVRHGVWRHVVSQSIDKRRIALKPAMPGASAGDNNKATTATKISNMELVRCVHRAIVSLPHHQLQPS